MSDNTQAGYREKYIHALKEQERIESQLSLQVDLLKKTLFQVGAAASGLDHQLDASLVRLRDVMRGGRGSDVVEQLESVQRVVGQFESSRALENQKAAKVMADLIQQYLALQLPTDIKTSLQSFSRSLKKRLQQYRQYPVALEDLVKLQQLALDAAMNPKASLWQRIKGGNTLKPDQPESSTSQASPETKLNQTEPTGDKASETDSELATTDISVSQNEAVPAERNYQNTSTPQRPLEDDEDGYKLVAERISNTLSNLVAKIEPNDIIKHRVDIVQMRLDRGMDWYVLAVTLEDIRDILFLRYMQADEDFSEYLNKVNVELSVIRDVLGTALNHGQQQSAAANLLSDHVSSGVERMRNSMDANIPVDELKKEVKEHISFIADALKTFKEQPQDSLEDKLKEMIAHVETIEKESQQTKEALEIQRYKATHDQLTELPNREAYTERAHHEMQRFQRYKRPLTMCICDIDRFKVINDTYGHQAGDKVLRLIAKVVSTRLRNVDFIARYGGEEFVVLMPETNAEQAFTVLDKIRLAVGKTSVRFKSEPVQITISFGIAAFSEKDSVESVFERADKALYKAKEDGRNRCIIAPSP